MRLSVILLAALLTSCNGILDGIYDRPSDHVDEGLPYGYKTVDDDRLGGTIFVDATSYTRWTYFDLRRIASDIIDFDRDITPDRLAQLEADRFTDGASWHLALHRSQPKTNGGSVAATRFASVAELSSACQQAGGVERLVEAEHLVFTPDELTDDLVAIDISDMFNGNVVYLPSLCNRVLDGWLDIDISNPPPIYTMSRRAYILRVGDDCYALCMTNFRNAQNLTAWLTIDFRYLP